MRILDHLNAKRLVLYFLIGSIQQATHSEPVNFERLKSFGYEDQGMAFYSELVQGSDGALYGTSPSSDADGGRIFKINSDGTGYQVLHRFSWENSAQGVTPEAALTTDTDGSLYGTTGNGGVFGSGTVYKLNKDGSGFAVLHDFDSGNPNDGAYPSTALIEGADGALYGTTSMGGVFGFGTVYKLHEDGSGFAVLHHFERGNPYDGTYPSAALIKGTDGALYGITEGGGSYGNGTVFKVNQDGSGFTLLHNFQLGNPDNGAFPRAALMKGSDGALYGTTSSGGFAGCGTVYRLNEDGSGFAVLHYFEADQPDNGFAPHAALIQASDGALYGTTFFGGGFNAGTLYKLNADGGAFALVHNFQPENAHEGFFPSAMLTKAPNGVLLGTTTQGGATGLGTIYKLNSTDRGTSFEVVLSGRRDAAHPNSQLIKGEDGALYGATPSGGRFNLGTVYRIEADGSHYNVLHEFQWSGGAYPYAQLILGADGALYGTTYQGGTFGHGTVYRLNADGNGFTLLHNFEHGNANNGAYPFVGLIKGADGALYGTTFSGGSFNYGTVYKLKENGSDFEVLHHFQTGNSNDGALPNAALIKGADGTLYGTSRNGGTYNGGTVYKLNENGTGFTLLHHLQSLRRRTVRAPIQ